MSKRFQIEDIIVQDASGVVFRAVDTTTSKTVALRRFFPFGADGGGLHAEEQTAYTIAVERLAGLSHPALRSVVCGGCDPVDGMPFIATEWVEGESLLPIVEYGPLPAPVTVQLITQALEVSELLSAVLAEEAVWVETDIQTIVVASEDSGRGFTFWISPLKWLGGGDEYRGIESIVKLTRVLMHWNDRMVSDQEGNGLGGWLNWLQNAAKTTSLLEVREMLAASVGAEPPKPSVQLVATATQPLAQRPRTRRPGSLKTLVFGILGISLILAGIGGWVWNHQRHRSESLGIPDDFAESAGPVPAPVPRPGSEADAIARVNRRAAELSAQMQAAREARSELPATQQAEAGKAGGIIPWTHRELLVQANRGEATVEGVLMSFGHSSSDKTLYLQFSKEPDRNEARGSIALSKAGPDLNEAALTPLIGRKIRITGKVEVQKIRGLERPDIQLTRRQAIELVD